MNKFFQLQNKLIEKSLFSENKTLLVQLILINCIKEREIDCKIYNRY